VPVDFCPARGVELRLNNRRRRSDHRCRMESRWPPVAFGLGRDQPTIV